MSEPTRAPKRRWAASLVIAAALAASAPVLAQTAEDQVVIGARDALRKGDKAQLAVAVAATQQHPLAQWVQYWDLSSRLNTAQVDEVEAFYARWPGTYVEDRLRNDWLLELGRRRDWANFSRDYPRFRMNDDREVTCYHLLTRHLANEDVRDAARSAWFAQRDLDDGCNLLATTLYAAGILTENDAWQKARLAVEAGRPAAARAAVNLASPESAKATAALLDKPDRHLKRKPERGDGVSDELATLALMRLAAKDPDAAADALRDRWQAALPAPLASLAWAAVAKQAALKLQPDAVDAYQRAWKLRPHRAVGRADPAPWSDDMLGWQVRAALRSSTSANERWSMVGHAVEAMSPAEQQDPAWVYWRARALQGSAKPGADGDADRLVARQLLESIAGRMTFYGKLATEDLGGSISLPPAPAPLSAAERDGARRSPGFSRALLLIDLGLRNEGVREWNFTLRGLSDRELLAAAQLACDRRVWDRCINTSDRTRAEVDMAQRFPMPFRKEVVSQAREIGLDPAYMYGLIRQESRFIMDARSSAGASGLMQLMPATARWTAKKIGIPFKPDMLTDRELNLKLGSAYLKLVLDEFEGSQAMAAAAYNAGPGRPRRWREGPTLEVAVWAENIPFSETRDYVKKVLSNAVYYGALLGAQPVSLKARLGSPIGPRDPSAPNDRDLP